MGKTNSVLKQYQDEMVASNPQSRKGRASLSLQCIQCFACFTSVVHGSLGMVPNIIMPSFCASAQAPCTIFSVSRGAAPLPSLHQLHLLCTISSLSVEVQLRCCLFDIRSRKAIPHH